MEALFMILIHSTMALLYGHSCDSALQAALEHRLHRYPLTEALTEIKCATAHIQAANHA